MTPCQEVVPRDHGPDMWFDWPQGNHGNAAGPIATAKAACQSCPLLVECRAAADAYEGGTRSTARVYGIWAGETPTERLRRRALDAAA